VQTTFSGKTRILPALPRAQHPKSRFLGKHELSSADDSAAFSDDFVLAVFLSRNFYKMNFRNDELGMMNDELKKLSLIHHSSFILHH
jgi:hypothetical protein